MSRCVLYIFPLGLMLLWHPVMLGAETAGKTSPIPQSNEEITGFNMDSKTGKIHIFLANGKIVIPPDEKDQVDVSDPALSAGGLNLGWVVDVDGGICCGSIPTMLVVYQHDGKIRTFQSKDQMIWGWAFRKGGHQVAIASGAVHGSDVAHYELYDIRTGRKIGEADDAIDDSKGMSYVHRKADSPLPKWAQGLTDATGQ